MNKKVKKYLDAKEDLKVVEKDYRSSWMDVSVRLDRVEQYKNEAIIALGTKALKEIEEAL
jgi:hypothetical protein